MMASKLLSNGYVVTPPPSKSQGAPTSPRPSTSRWLWTLRRSRGWRASATTRSTLGSSSRRSSSTTSRGRLLAQVLIMILLKDVQNLTGCMATLNSFISRLGERGLPFFKLLKCQDKFQWMEEAEQSLQNLKNHFQSPPVLTAPLPREDLLLYIAATTHIVSSAIIVERCEEGHAFGVQRPVYFVSEVLFESKV
jgi:hypothetical protein